MINSVDEKYTRDKKQFFRAATASGLLMLLFYVIPFIVQLLIRFADKLFSINLADIYYNTNSSFEVSLFIGGIYQIIYLLLAIFIVTRFYKFKPFSVFKKYGFADEKVIIGDEYGLSYSQLDEIEHEKAKKPSSLTWDKILLIGIPVMYAINVVSSWLSFGITKLVNNAGYTVPDVTLDLSSNNPLNVILLFVRLAVLAPLIEEFLMRGCMLRILKPYGNWFAIIITSVMFGLLHNNIGQGIGAVAIGILFGIIAIKSESIYPTIVLHGVNNFIVSMMTVLGGQFGNKAAYEAVGSVLRVIAFGGIIMLGLFFRKINLKNDNTSALKTGQCVRRYIFNPAVLCYIAANLFIFVLLFFVEN